MNLDSASSSPNSGEKSDLTGYAALIGESFQSRVDLLGRLLQTRHFPSLGTYKERLLSEAIKSFLPGAISVGTGFVLFPCDHENPPADGAYFDKLNQSAFEVSRQCDIIVYDAHDYPPIFKDGDFVVVRPESVKAIIEVKGNGSRAEIAKSLVSFLDFGRKWQRTQKFYREHHQSRSPDPQLHCFCWSAPDRKRGQTGDAVRKQIAKFYGQNVTLNEFGAFPFLTSLMIYNDWEISEMQGHEREGENFTSLVGWASRRGRFLRLSAGGELFLDRDRTVASLLSNLHWATARDKFNRFFSYPDEVRSAGTNVLEQRGVTWAWTTQDVEPIRKRNKDELAD